MCNKSVILFVALVLCSLDLSTCTTTLPSTGSNFKTEEWKLVLPESSFIFQSRDRIVVISTNWNLVNLSYVGNDEFSCIISTGTENANYLSNGQALGNGKLVLFGKQSVDNKHKSRLTFVIVDPNDCSAEIATKDCVAEEDSPTSEAQLVAYYESFDVFSDTCSPCQYDDRGQQVNDLSHRLLESTVEAHKYMTFFVRPIKEFDSSKGYFYALTYPNATISVIRILNSDFKVKRQKIVNKEIISAFVNIEGIIEVCSVRRIALRRLSTCERLSNDLRVIGGLGEHISHEKNFVRVIARPFSKDLSWMTLSFFRTKYNANNVQKTCLQAPGSSKNSICNTIETPRFNLNLFVFPDKACFYVVDYYTAKREIEIKCVVSMS